MKRLLTFLWVGLFIGLLGGLQEASATHLMGSDIIYRCLGNGKYEITVRVYRDCNGVSLSQSNILVSCSSTTLTLSNQTKVSVRDITGIDPNCPTQSRCQNQWTYGIEEHVFRTTVDLSSYSCCEWTISWSQSARNSNITTGQANQNFYTFAKLNKCVTPCNSSPDFTNPPVAIVCHNQDFIFNNGALDTNDVGDSLSYSFAPALTNANSSTTYTGQYSANNPIGYFGFPNKNLSFPAGLHLDPVTGDIMFRPTVMNQIAILVIEVKEWRKVNGVMTVVGVTRRDMQIIVIPCPNNKVPKIKPPYVKQACAGQKVCLTIETEDEDQGDTVKISWNRGIKGATFTNNNGQVKYASGEVCWTPTKNDISNIPYTFTITAKDNSCSPFPGQSVRAFSIFVRETPEAEVFTDVLTCGRVAIDHTPAKSYAGYGFNYVIRDSLNKAVWSSSTKVDTAFLQPGWHRLFLNVQTSTPCFNIVTDSIFIPDFVQVTLPSDTFVCNGLPIDVLSQTRGGNSPYTYEWARMTDTGASAVISTADQITVNNDSLETYMIRVLDGNGCKNYDTVQVGWYERPTFNLGLDQRICYGSSFSIKAKMDSLQPYTYQWSTGDTSEGIDVYDSNAYWVRVQDTVGCWYTDTMNLFVNKVEPDAGYNRDICENQTLNLTGFGGDSYEWYQKEGFTYTPLPTPLGTSQQFSAVITKSQGFIVRATQTYGGLTCVGYDSIDITMNPLPEITLTAPNALCLNASPISLASSIQYPTLFNGDWRSDITPKSVANDFFYPNKAGVNANPGHEVIYHVVDANGCENEKPMRVKVNPLPVVDLMDSLVVCGDIGIVNLNDIKVKPSQGQTIQGIPSWVSLDGNPMVDNAIEKTFIHNQKLNIGALTQGASYGLIFNYTDNASKCSNADTAIVRVKTVPKTNAGILPQFCWNDPEFDLNDANNLSPKGGVWTSLDMPMSGTSSITPSDIGAANKFTLPGTSARFVYTITQEGCAKADTTSSLIKGIPDLQLTPVDGWCENAGIIDLNTKTNLPGGVWSGKGVNGFQFNPVTAGVASTHTIKYRYTSMSTSCSVEDSFGMEVQAAPSIELITSDKACEGVTYGVEIKTTNASSILVETLGDGSFGSANSGQNSSTTLKSSYFPGVIDNDALGFNLVAQTTNNRFCAPASMSKHVEIFPLPSASIEADPIKGCDPLTVNLKAISDANIGAKYEWDLGNGTVKSGSDEVKTFEEVFVGANIYTVNLKVTSREEEGGCVQNAEPIQIEVLPTPVADFTVNRWETTVALPGIQFKDLSTVESPASIVDWYWTFGDHNNSSSTEQHPFFEYPVTNETDTGTFLVRLNVTADNGCEAYDTGNIHIGPDITVFIPNAFTPNNFGESINDRFYVIADGFETFEIAIYNRWGEKLYQSADIKEGWDGRYKGEDVQQDVYVYVVRVTSLGGKELEYYGTITLLR